MVRFLTLACVYRGADTMFNAPRMLHRNSCIVFAPQVQTPEEDVP